MATGETSSCPRVCLVPAAEIGSSAHLKCPRPVDEKITHTGRSTQKDSIDILMVRGSPERVNNGNN